MPGSKMRRVSASASRVRSSLKHHFIVAVLMLAGTACLRSPEETDLVDWLVSHGGYIAGLDMFRFDPMGRGFVALRDLPVNTSVLHIPPKLIISRKTMAASEDPTVKSLMHNLDAESAVKAWLLWEKSLADRSFFAPYIAILPPYVPSLLHFADASLQELDDEKFAAEVRRYQERIASEHMAVAEVWRSAGIRKELSLSDYVWATTIFDSRGLRFKGEVHLAPMADMFNYEPHGMSRQFSSGEFFLEHHALSSAGGLSITADRDTKMGEQLFEDYGDTTDEIYLKCHSFVAEVNPFRCVPIDGSLSFEVLLIQGTGEAQSGLAGKSALPRYTSDLLDVMGLHDTPSRCIDTPGQLGKKLEVFFVILALNEAEAVDCAKSIAQYPNDWGKIFRVCPYNSMISFLQSESLATFAHPHKDSLKNRVLSGVRETIESSVKGYRTTIEQDIEKIHALQTALRACSGMAPQQQNGSDDSLATGSEPVSEAEAELGLSIAACDESNSAGPITEKMHRLMAVRYRMYLKLHWLAVCEHYGARCEQSLRSVQSGAREGTWTQRETAGGSGSGSGAGSKELASVESIPMNTVWQIYRKLDRKGLLLSMRKERGSSIVADEEKEKVGQYGQWHDLAWGQQPIEEAGGSPQWLLRQRDGRSASAGFFVSSEEGQGEGRSEGRRLRVRARAKSRRSAAFQQEGVSKGPAMHEETEKQQRRAERRAERRAAVAKLEWEDEVAEGSIGVGEAVAQQQPESLSSALLQEGADGKDAGNGEMLANTPKDSNDNASPGPDIGHDMYNGVFNGKPHCNERTSENNNSPSVFGCAGLLVAAADGQDTERADARLADAERAERAAAPPPPPPGRRFNVSAILEDRNPLLETYLINLDRRPERLEHMSQELRRMGISFQRFPAVDGRRVKLELEHGVVPGSRRSKIALDLRTRARWDHVLHQVKVSNNLDFGQVGAWQSHLQVLFQIDRKNAETQRRADGPVLVLEDDVGFANDFRSKLRLYMMNLPADWDVFAAGHFGSYCERVDYPMFCRAYEFWGMHGYVLRNHSVVQRLIGCFNSGRFQIADFVWQDMFRSELNAYIALPRTLIFQQTGKFGSDISGSGHDFDQFKVWFKPSAEYSPFWREARKQHLLEKSREEAWGTRNGTYWKQNRLRRSSGKLVQPTAHPTSHPA